MQKADRDTNLNREYHEFLAADQALTVPVLGESLLSIIHTDLNPSPWKVFGKISMIQLLVGSSTLLFCPQFGIAPTSSMGLMPYLMQYGEGVCMLGCGAFFTGLSLLTSSLILRPEEVRAIRSRKVLQLTSLSTLSLGAFLCLGGEVFETITFVWILGSILGGAASIELGWAMRRSLHAGAKS